MLRQKKRVPLTFFLKYKLDEVKTSKNALSRVDKGYESELKQQIKRHKVMQVTLRGVGYQMTSNAKKLVFLEQK